MEVRKIQITGGSSYMITLPKSWVEAHGLKKNDPVYLMLQKDGSLLLLPESEKSSSSEVKEITLGTEVDGDLLFRSLVAAYMSGASIIKIRSSEGISAEIREAVRRFTIKAIGQEILEEAEETVITKNLLNPIEMSLESVIRRMAILVRSMVEDSITALLHESRELGEEVLARDDDLDRLYWLIVRQQNIIARNPAVAEKMSVNQTSSFHFSFVGRALERSGDHACRMAKSSMALIPEKLDPEEKSRIADASKLSLGILEDSVSTFLERDLKRANRIIERAEDLLEAYQDIQFRALRHSPGVAIAMSNLADSLRRIGEYGRGICEQTINHVVSLEDELKLS